MKTFLGISKPSEAIVAMCDGLEKQSQREDFRIDMYTYGRAASGICYGCAATCALQQLLEVDFEVYNIRFPNILIEDDNERHELSNFEYTINDVRCGNIEELFEFFEKECPQEYQLTFPKYRMDTWNYKEKIPLFRELAEKLKSQGY